MDAANRFCRCLYLAAALAVLLGCQSDRGAQVRAQGPNDPLGPIAPLQPPPGGSPNGPLGPVVPAAPVPGAPVIGTAPPAAGGPVAPAAFASAARTPDALAASEPRVKVIAVVGSSLTAITDQEVRESVWQKNAELARLDGRERAAKQKELYTAALRRAIERELVLDEMYAKLKKAGKANVIDEVKEAATLQTDQWVRALKKEIGAKTDDDFATFLRVQGLTAPVLRRQFEREMMARQYVNGVLKEKGRRASLADVRDYYDRHPQEFATKDRVKWQHLFVSAAKHGTAEAALQRAKALHGYAASGHDLGALSKQYDDGIAGQQNGFGVGERKGEILPADIEDAVLALKPGQLGGPIQTPTGYHIVKVLEREHAGVRPFDAKVQNDIREKLNDLLYEADRAKLIEELWRKGVVRVVEEP